MLSRVADSIYWMSRYLERAEDVSRYLDVNWYLTLDLPSQEFQQWGPLVSVTGDYDLFIRRYGHASKANVISFLTFDADYPHSIISCLRAARENARTIREIISFEMWEQINTLYHLVENAARKPSKIWENPYEFCQRIRTGGMLVAGIANDTFMHDEAWHFFQLGRMLERADKTTRILDVKYFILLPSPNYIGTAYDDIQWAALLRTTGALDAYRHNIGKISPGNVVDFLLLNREFPRSVLYCLIAAQYSLHFISGTPIGAFRNKAEQLLGHLCAEFSYKTVDAIIDKGLHEFIDQLQSELNDLHNDISEIFFNIPQNTQYQFQTQS